jgi:hypothetical protein
MCRRNQASTKAYASILYSKNINNCLQSAVSVEECMLDIIVPEA